MASRMIQKFIALQIVLVTFGVALFFALAYFKEKRAPDVVVALDVVAEEVVEEEVLVEPVCDFPEWIGKPVKKDAARETGRPYRILAPDSMATMDFIPNRINIHIDENGIVIKVLCG